MNSFKFTLGIYVFFFASTFASIVHKNGNSNIFIYSLFLLIVYDYYLHIISISWIEIIFIDALNNSSVVSESSGCECSTYSCKCCGDINLHIPHLEGLGIHINYQH